MQEVSWYSDKNLLPRDQDRTDKLIDRLEYTNGNEYNTLQHAYQGLIDKFINNKNYGGIPELISYIKKHPDMLKYKFDKDQKLIKIIVAPNSFFTFKQKSKERQCDMSYGITELLKLHVGHLPIGVEMANETDCNSQGFESKLQPQPTTYESESDIPVSAGGSKSRRKPARKTRRGRGRGRSRKPKSNAKSKTHRHRRHSRVRKHKKYTRKH
jgi:hypothetical protein